MTLGTISRQGGQLMRLGSGPARLLDPAVKYALKFTAASNQYVSLASPPITAGNFSIAFFFKLNSILGSQEFFAQGSLAPNVDNFQVVTTTGHPGLSVNSNTFNFVSGSTALLTNIWYHGAVTYDSVATSMSIYLNGSLDGGPFTGTPDYTATGARIGGVFASAFALDGWLADFRIYNSVLSAGNVSTLASGLYVAGAAHYWQFGEGTGTSTADSGLTGGLTGTLTNGPTWTTDHPYLT